MFDSKYPPIRPIDRDIIIEAIISLFIFLLSYIIAAVLHPVAILVLVVALFFLYSSKSLQENIMENVAWFYVALNENEHKDISGLFEDEDWVRKELFDLAEDSNSMLSKPEAVKRYSRSPLGERSEDRSILQCSDQNTAVQLIEGTTYNDMSDTHWKFWGITVFSLPGCANCEVVATRLANILKEHKIPKKRFQIAYFQEGTDGAYTQIENGSNV